MKSKSYAARGQALILIAFGIIGLVAMTGLAVDSGMAFSDHRHAQNAADTAAMAGAMAKIKAEEDGYEAWADYFPYVVNAASTRADENGYFHNITSSRVYIYTCDMPASNCGYYDGDPDYVQVIIESDVDTFFARVIGIPQVHNRVQAVALADEGYSGSLFGGNAIVELKPTGSNCSSGSGQFIVGGSGTVNIYGGGVLVNSDNSCAAFQQNGCNTTLNLYAGGEINLVPGAGASLQSSCPELMPPLPWEVTDPIDWPPTYYMLPEPSACSQTPASPTFDGVNTTTLYPGYYNILPPNGLSGSNVRLSPGNYCVSNVLKAVGSSTSLEGTDIFIYIQPGGDFELRGGSVSLVANTTDYSSIYRGYLIYVAPPTGYEDFSASPTACVINGGAVSQLTGAILAPYCDITINGSSGSTGLMAQLIGYTITLSGDNVLNFYYDAALSPTIEIDPEVGLMH